MSQGHEIWANCNKLGKEQTLNVVIDTSDIMARTVLALTLAF